MYTESTRQRDVSIFQPKIDMLTRHVYEGSGQRLALSEHLDGRNVEKYLRPSGFQLVEDASFN